jgi:hypothetical protein
VQQTLSSSAANSADGSSQSISRSLRSRLMPLAAAAPKADQTAPATQEGAASPAAGLSAQLFCVFTNPLSSAGAADAKSSKSSQHSRSRAVAAMPAAESPEFQEPGQLQQETQHAAGAGSPPAADATAAAAGAVSTEAADAVQACSTSYDTHAGKASMQQDGLQHTYCFEVQAAGSEPEQLIDYRGHDQHGDDMFGPDGQIQQLGGSMQQYVYDEVSLGRLL